MSDNGGYDDFYSAPYAGGNNVPYATPDTDIDGTPVNITPGNDTSLPAWEIEFADGTKIRRRATTIERARIQAQAERLAGDANVSIDVTRVRKTL